MKKRTDQELIAILTVAKSNYLSEALEAAKAEFQQRGLAGEEVERVTQELEFNSEIANKKAAKPLDPAIAILSFLLPIPVALIVVSQYRSAGYDRKARDVAKYSLLGIIIYAVLSFVYLIFHPSPDW